VAVELWWLIEAGSCEKQQRFETGIRNYQPEIESNQPKIRSNQPEIRSNQPEIRSISKILDQIS
jgi:hypothetical protein